MKSKRLVIYCIVLAIFAIGLKIGLDAYSRPPHEPHAAGTLDKRLDLSPLFKYTVPDQSFDEDQFVAYGLPACDHDWTKAELQIAVTKLTQFGKDRPDNLPVLDSSRSGRVFDHLLLACCLGTKKVEGQSKESREDTLVSGHANLRSLTRIYAEAGKANENRYAASIVELTGAMLSNLASFLDVGQQIVDVAPPNSQDREQRLSAFEYARKLAAVSLASSVSILCDQNPDSYKNDLEPLVSDRLADHCINFGPAIAKHLTIRQRYTIVELLDLRLRRQNADPLGQKLSQLRAALIATGPLSSGPTTGEVVEPPVEK
jgi:hypothetical protein